MPRLKSREFTLASRMCIAIAVALEVAILGSIAMLIFGFIPLCFTVVELCLYGHQCQYITAEKADRKLVGALKQVGAGGEGEERKDHFGEERCGRRLKKVKESFQRWAAKKAGLRERRGNDGGGCEVEGGES